MGTLGKGKNKKAKSLTFTLTYFPFTLQPKPLVLLGKKRPISWVATYYTAHTPLRKKCQTNTSV